MPLSIVLFVSLVKEGFEDWKRLQNDTTINNSPVDLLQGKRWEPVPWKMLQVGDIIRVEQDLLFLATTNPDGVNLLHRGCVWYTGHDNTEHNRTGITVPRLADINRVEQTLFCSFKASNS